MAQYDVYPNPSPRSREFVPYVIDVQSALLDSLPTRLTMPLSRVGVQTSGISRRLVPQFEVNGELLVLLAHAAAGIDARSLNKAVTSLSEHAGEIRDALDAVVSGV